MNCAELKPLIDGYFDQELDLVRSLEIEKHMEGCTSCADHLKHLQSLRTTLHTAHLNESAPDSLKIFARSLGTSRNKKRTFWRWLELPQGTPLGVPALAVVMLVIITPMIERQRGDQRLADEIVTVHVRSLMATHLVDVVSSDQHTVRPWFTGKIDFAPWVKDLQEFGFPLKGGRLEYVAHHPAAALVYQRHQHVINLILWPQPEEHDHAPADLTRRGYNLVHWTQAGMTYWAISDLNREELQQFSQIIQAQTLPTPS